jgi:hypothetical protein
LFYRPELIAAESLTPGRLAAARRLMHSFSTASITRLRKSCEYAAVIHDGLHPSQQVESNSH